MHKRTSNCGESSRRKSPASQLELRLATWGGRRKGSGRKRSSVRAMVPHRARPNHSKHHPVHVTMRVAHSVPNMRRQVVFARLSRALAKASRPPFRVLHFSVQSNHLHLIVEAIDKLCLSRGIAGLSIRLARGINRAADRRGQVWGDRYHARALRTPRETRHALVYVLMNFKKHGHGAGTDSMSSACWFDGWKVMPRLRAPPSWAAHDDAPVRRPHTWLAREGWRRHGLIREDELPSVE